MAGVPRSTSLNQLIQNIQGGAAVGADPLVPRASVVSANVLDKLPSAPVGRADTKLKTKVKAQGDPKNPQTRGEGGTIDKIMGLLGGS